MKWIGWNVYRIQFKRGVPLWRIIRCYFLAKMYRSSVHIKKVRLCGRVPFLKLIEMKYQRAADTREWRESGNKTEKLSHVPGNRLKFDPVHWCRHTRISPREANHTAGRMLPANLQTSLQIVTRSSGATHKSDLGKSDISYANGIDGSSANGKLISTGHP